jgi:cytochrome b561
VKNRVAFLLGLDSAMLLLVVVLECINFTGLQWHQWLGFAFCPVVLLHVVLQWQWFITQFQRMLTPGAWRVRVNAGLNLLLLWLMAAVLFSGVFVSSQAVEALGESFGRVRVWSEVHGWLNVALVMMVGLHLGLNWDWIIVALGACTRPLLTRRQTELGSTGVSQASRSAAADVPRTAALCSVGWMRSFGRAVAVLLVAALAAGGSYFAMEAILLQKMRARIDRAVAAGAIREGNQPMSRATEPARNLLAPRNRPLTMRKAPDVVGALLLTLFSAVIGRYVFRLRL